MKLIDILVKETIENGWSWPVGCNSIAQDEYHGDREGDIYAYVNALNGGNHWFEDNDSGYGQLLFKGYEVAEDAATSLVTRQQYEVALTAKNDGWIEWGGGEHPPVSTNTVVDVKFKNGNVQSGYPAGEYSWEHEWAYSNIIAYRLHKPQEAEQAKADDEADLNECIGQDVAPVWNGEGLPPVGMKVEWLSDKYGWLGGTVAAHDAKYPLIAIIRHNDGYTGCHRHEIRTEAERKREAARNGIYAAMDIVDGDIADAIYDAIAAGKIPGVKLED